MKRKRAIMNTSIEKRCEILSDLWMKYGDEAELSDFMEYNDLGLALAFAIHEDIVKSTVVAEAYINESFDLLLESMSIDDNGYDTLDEIFKIG
jgi:hypothetical protein